MGIVKGHGCPSQANCFNANAIVGEAVVKYSRDMRWGLVGDFMHPLKNLFA